MLSPQGKSISRLADKIVPIYIEADSIYREAASVLLFIMLFKYF